ncbi:hypothetical protein MYXO_03713 [Myxococcaceae bacterium]|jgi:mono/diheme cytochrome c family protein|nr:hypothetical protein MYXO_03713 [Myxococcaceae bacterium]
MVGVLAVGTLAAIGCVDERRDEARGSALYALHCASCHGPGGRGDGPNAAGLDPPPGDLTTLARRSGGRFDETAVMMAIDGRRAIAQHGPREMPVWGTVFAAKHEGEPFAAYEPTVDVRAIADHLRTLQQD